MIDRAGYFARHAMPFSDRLSDYDFDLPNELIAQTPPERRDGARLLVVRREPERGLPRYEDLLVTDLPQLLREDARELATLPWVRNRSQVFPARFYARRPTGGRHEIVLLEPIASTEGRPSRKWRCMVRGMADFRYPQKLLTDTPERHMFFSTEPGVVDFESLDDDLFEFLRRRGEMPLPPYIKDRIRERDLDRYQAIWADPARTGSAAAPTASLHFSESLLAALPPIEWLDLHLHVGLGTFAPLRSETISGAEIHGERLEAPVATLNRLAELRREWGAKSRFCVSVGTTALRALESLDADDPARPSKLVEEAEVDPAFGLAARTRAFIRPGFEFAWTRALWTNFHLPQSTLLVLVATFCGSRKLALESYNHAIQKKYRFFSYGDASLWI